MIFACSIKQFCIFYHAKVACLNSLGRSAITLTLHCIFASYYLIPFHKRQVYNVYKACISSFGLCQHVWESKLEKVGSFTTTCTGLSTTFPIFVPLCRYHFHDCCARFWLCLTKILNYNDLSRGLNKTTNCCMCMLCFWYVWLCLVFVVLVEPLKDFFEICKTCMRTH